MKLNRRKAMAAMVGGASTAPQAARAFAENITKNNTLISSMPLNYGEEKQIGSYDPIEYAQKLAREKEYLTKIVNGDLAGMWHEGQVDQSIKEYTRAVRNYHIDSLKSVSYTNKERIKHEKQLEQMKQDWISNAKEQLLRLFNKKPGDIF